MALLLSPAAAFAQEETADPAIRRGAVPHVPGYTAAVLELAEGEVLSAGTCGVDGATFHGDTTLRLHAPDSEIVATNDDACGGLGSYFEHRARTAGSYSLVSGCFSGSTSCGGTIAYTIGPRGDSSASPPPVPLRIQTSVRGLFSPDPSGGAVLLDAVLEWRIDELFLVRLAGAPLALAGGDLGGVVGGSLSLVAGLAVDWIELGLGAGVAVLGSRFGNPGTKEAATFAMHARIGRLSMFHVDGQLTMASFNDTFEVIAGQLTVRVPVGPVDLSLRAAAGHDGVVLGEAGAVIWLVSSPERPILGLSLHLGAGMVFYQPVCRFGAACADMRSYVGPVAGAGIEWRP